MILYDFDTVLSFGQHEGQTIAEALIENPTYPEWCYINIEDFYVTDSVWEALDFIKKLIED